MNSLQIFDNFYQFLFFHCLKSNVGIVIKSFNFWLSFSCLLVSFLFLEMTDLLKKKKLFFDFDSLTLFFLALTFPPQTKQLIHLCLSFSLRFSFPLSLSPLNVSPLYLSNLFLFLFSLFTFLSLHARSTIYCSLFLV